MKWRAMFSILVFAGVAAMVVICTPLRAADSHGTSVTATTDTSTTTGTVKPPDNTGRNVRDRHNQTLTPLDQKNNKADLAMTRQIRKKIVAEKKISTNAKNVKIITIDGKVTLRGPVKNAEEKRLIGEIANLVAKSKSVDNQLEVKE